MYQAVIVSKLVYGLETLQFTEAQGRQLDTFQQRGLRKILGIAPTFIDRTNTNEDVLQIANKEKGADKDPTKAKIIPVTQMIENRKNALLGHVIRAGERDPRDPKSFVNGFLQFLAPKSKNPANILPKLIKNR